jgi:hypothetical protein
LSALRAGLWAAVGTAATPLDSESVVSGFAVEGRRFVALRLCFWLLAFVFVCLDLIPSL